MSFLTPEYLIESAKRHVENAKYWRSVGDLVKAAAMLDLAKERRLLAAEIIRGL